MNTLRHKISLIKWLTILRALNAKTIRKALRNAMSNSSQTIWFIFRRKEVIRHFRPQLSWTVSINSGDLWSGRVRLRRDSSGMWPNVRPLGTSAVRSGMTSIVSTVLSPFAVHRRKWRTLRRISNRFDVYLMHFKIHFDFTIILLILNIWNLINMRNRIQCLVTTINSSHLNVFINMKWKVINWDPNGDNILLNLNYNFFYKFCRSRRGLEMRSAISPHITAKIVHNLTTITKWKFTNITHNFGLIFLWVCRIRDDFQMTIPTKWASLTSTLRSIIWWVCSHICCIWWFCCP